MHNRILSLNSSIGFKQNTLLESETDIINKLKELGRKRNTSEGKREFLNYANTVRKTPLIIRTINDILKNIEEETYEAVKAFEESVRVKMENASKLIDYCEFSHVRRGSIPNNYKECLKDLINDIDISESLKCRAKNLLKCAKV